ncbi:Polycomb group protein VERNALIZATION 2 [Glycine max]|nr:Polycomb group protein VERNALIZATION 2 [Glycine max]
MCRQNSPVHHAGEEEIAADESLLIYCKPVELYNILYRRALQNPSFLRRCLRYKIRASRKRRLRAGIVIFNYRDRYNILRKTEVTEDFSCPFCLMQCGNFKGLRFHLCSSHDLFNFEFWVTEDYQAVNVSVKIDILRSEDSVQIEKRTNVKFLELDSPEGIHNGFLQKDDGRNHILSCKGENVSRTSRSEKIFPSGRNDGGKFGPDHPGTMDNLEHVESSFNIPGVSIAMPQSSVDPECSKSICKSDPALPAKTKKLSMDRSDSRNRMLLQKRLFFHSHRVQPMALEQVLSDRDSEDEVDDDIADLEDRRMLDDFVDVSKDEKQLMHLWNSFMRKQRCWRLFMIKLWNHGLLDACTMNNCSIVLDSYRNEGSGSHVSKRPLAFPEFPPETLETTADESTWSTRLIIPFVFIDTKPGKDAKEMGMFTTPRDF